MKTSPGVPALVGGNEQAGLFVTDAARENALHLGGWTPPFCQNNRSPHDDRVPFSLVAGHSPSWAEQLEGARLAGRRMQHRVVLFHFRVLMQGPSPGRALARQKGAWCACSGATSAAGGHAGRTVRAVPGGRLTCLTITDSSPLDLAASAVRETPGVMHRKGDIAVCLRVWFWLVDHVRWDLEEDLSRLIGDAAHHTPGAAPWHQGALGSSPTCRRDRPAAHCRASGKAPVTPGAPFSTIVWAALRHGLDELALTSFGHPLRLLAYRLHRRDLSALARPAP